ncbi:MAG: iron-sulfur cluster repair di-iron protein [Ilumatobacteraceae bacterium]
MTIDATSSLADVVTRHPALARELEVRGLDYCCGGATTLEQACIDQGLDPVEIVHALSLADTGAEPAPWATMGAVQLVDHLESTHHRYLWDELPRLDALAHKVLEVHGERHPELAGIRACVDEIRTDLEPHMTREEQVLFPAIRELATASTVPAYRFGSIKNPISVMLREHDVVGHLLEDLREMTNGFATPDDGCASYRALFDGLAELEADTHLHVHKENNLLFPAVVAIEARLIT